jgi:hypothetical protein
MLTLRDARGFTLTELLLAAGLAGLVVLAAETVFGTAVRLQVELRERNRGSGPGSQEASAGYAVLHLAKHLELADRLVRNGADSVQMRIPPFSADLGDLDEELNYRWDQYRREAATGELRYYRGGCAAPLVLAREVDQFTIDYRDRAANPPGGQVFSAGPEDNNVLEYVLRWRDGPRTHAFRGETTGRELSYTDLGANAGDSGWGLLPPYDGAPPPPC